MKCLYYATPLCDCMTGEVKTIEQWFNSNNELSMLAYDPFSDEVFVDSCIDIHFGGIQEVFEIEFDNGSREVVTMNHKLLCGDGLYYTIQEIIDKKLNVVEVVYE